jgi:bile acid-coenzyme A ligase
LYDFSQMTSSPKLAAGTALLATIVLIVERQDGGADTLTWLQMEEWANRMAHRLAEAGVKQKSFVAINLPNNLEHVVGTLAAYKLGACPMRVSYRIPARGAR